MKDMICSIDTETTGLDEKARIVELAIVPVTDDFEVDDTRDPLRVLVNPGKDYWDSLVLPSPAMLFNGLSRDVIAMDGVDPADLPRIIDRWRLINGINKIRPLGQNWSFDSRKLIDEITFDHYSDFFHRDIMDVKRLAQGINDRAGLFGLSPQFPSTSLQKLAKQFGIDSGKAHTALDDAVAAVKVYRELLGTIRGANDER